MIDKVVDKLTKISLKNGIIEENQIAVYQYGIRNVAMTAIYALTILMIGVITGSPGILAVYLAAFIPLRVYAGGYHMKHRLSCYLATSLVLLFTSLILQNSGLLYHAALWHIAAAAAYLLIMAQAPVATESKSFDEKEKQVYGRRAKGILQVEAILYIVLSVCGYTGGAAILLMSMVQAALLLLFGIMDNKLHIND